jgi:hypothetical protein
MKRFSPFAWPNSSLQREAVNTWGTIQRAASRIKIYVPPVRLMLSTVACGRDGNEVVCLGQHECDLGGHKITVFVPSLLGQDVIEKCFNDKSRREIGLECIREWREELAARACGETSPLPQIKDGISHEASIRALEAELYPLLRKKLLFAVLLHEAVHASMCPFDPANAQHGGGFGYQCERLGSVFGVPAPKSHLCATAWPFDVLNLVPACKARGEVEVLQPTSRPLLVAACNARKSE